jgi:hypothetical protein
MFQRECAFQTTQEFKASSLPELRRAPRAAAEGLEDLPEVLNKAGS